MDHSTQEVTIPNGTGTPLRGRFIFPAGMPVENLPVVILLSGDGPKGTKSLSWVNLPPLLADRGIASFLFDFEGLGYSEGKRSELTVDRAMSNFAAAWEFAVRNDSFDVNRFAIFASSFGAAVALLSPEIANRAKLLGLKSPASFLADAYVNECSDDELHRWIADRYSVDLNYDLGVLKSALRHNPYESATRITSSTLISHGSEDSIVPVRQSKLLQIMLSGPVRLEIFGGVGHSYSEEGAWDRMAKLFVSWFVENL